MKTNGGVGRYTRVIPEALCAGAGGVVTKLILRSLLYLAQLRTSCHVIDLAGAGTSARIGDVLAARAAEAATMVALIVSPEVAEMVSVPCVVTVPPLMVRSTTAGLRVGVAPAV